MADLGLTWEKEYLTGRQYRLTQHLKPIAYDDAGTLRRIVSDWVDSGISARPHIVTASQLMTSVGDDGMRRIHPTREADRYLEIGAPYVKISGTWRKVSFSNTVRTANLLAWTRPEANLAILHADHYVKLGMELKGGYVPEDNLVAFPVGLSGLTRQGAKILADGQTVALLRAPVAYDAANESDVRKIGYQFTTLNSQPYLVMTLPSLAGMTRPVVDPTIDVAVTSTADDGFWVPGGGINTSGIAIGREFGSPRSAFARFDDVTIPDGATIDSATFSLRGRWTDSGKDVRSLVRACDAADPDAPTTGAQADGLARTTASTAFNRTSTTADAWYDIDVQAQIAELVASYSYASGAAILMLADENSSPNSPDYNRLIFYDYSDGDTATLVVVYTEGGGGETAALTLARTAAIAPTGKATAGVSLSIARQMTLGEAGSAAAGAVMSLAREATLADGGGAAAAGNLTLARQIALATVGQAQAAAGLALALQRALIVGGINVTSVTLDLGRIAGIAPSGSAASSAEVALARYLQMLLAGEGIAHAAVSLGRALELAALGSEPALTATLDLGRVVGLSLSAGATAEAALELARRQALDAVAVAVAAAGLSLSNVRSVVMRGLNLVVTVTLARTYVVEAESRVFTVPAEGRTYTVEAENRTYTVTD